MLYIRLNLVHKILSSKFGIILIRVKSKIVFIFAIQDTHKLFLIVIIYAKMLAINIAEENVLMARRIFPESLLVMPT